MANHPIPPWIRFTSYIKPRRLEVVHSAFTGDMEVVLSDGRCMLNSRDATYSYEDKYTSYRSAIFAIKKRLPGYRNVLILGLGLGSVPYMLQTIFHFRGAITCIEIDPAVIALAKKYYPNTALYRKLTVHEADAVQWVMENNHLYDAIFCDIFIDKRVPKPLHSEAFLQKLRNSLAPGGTLLFSRLASERKAEVTLWKHLSAIFPEAEDIDTGGNYILNYQAKK